MRIFLRYVYNLEALTITLFVLGAGLRSEAFSAPCPNFKKTTHSDIKGKRLNLCLCLEIPMDLKLGLETTLILPGGEGQSGQPTVFYWLYLQTYSLKCLNIL